MEAHSAAGGLRNNWIQLPLYQSQSVLADIGLNSRWSRFAAKSFRSA